MISEIPWITLSLALAALVGLFFVLKGFKMPSSFYKNQQKRKELQKKLKIAEKNLPRK